MHNHFAQEEIGIEGQPSSLGKPKWLLDFLLKLQNNTQDANWKQSPAPPGRHMFPRINLKNNQLFLPPCPLKNDSCLV